MNRVHDIHEAYRYVVLLANGDECRVRTMRYESQGIRFSEERLDLNGPGNTFVPFAQVQKVIQL